MASLKPEHFEFDITVICCTVVPCLQALLTQPGGLRVVAVGSVLTKAWELLKEGT